MNAWMKNLTKEGSVEFGNGKKPEQLVRQILEMTTSPGDWVLDSFLGSGTTAAVATKMNRKWVCIELGEHAYTHCKVRLDRVIMVRIPEELPSLLIGKAVADITSMSWHRAFL